MCRCGLCRKCGNWCEAIAWNGSLFRNALSGASSRNGLRSWRRDLARAERLGCLRGLTCGHESHAERARGLIEVGMPKASDAAEYPVLFSATVAGILTWGKVRAELPGVQSLLQSDAAARLQRAGESWQEEEYGGRERSEERRASDQVEDGEEMGWRASWEAMPVGWDERVDVLARGASTTGEADCPAIYLEEASRAGGSERVSKGRIAMQEVTAGERGE